MPIPKPGDGESQSDFIERCMGDDTMASEYPDETQRLAVCHQQWDDRSVRAALSEFDGPGHARGGYFDAEIRAEDGDDGPIITGYAAVFDSWSPDYGGFTEVVRESAFDAALAENADVRGLFNHEPDRLLGRTSAGTMTLSKTKRGLKYTIRALDTPTAQEVRAHIKAGNITGSSFSFTVRRDGPDGGERLEVQKNGKIKRELLSVDLYDVGPVTFPFYPQSTAGARALRSLERATKLHSGYPYQVDIRRARSMI